MATRTLASITHPPTRLEHSISLVSLLLVDQRARGHTHIHAHTYTRTHTHTHTHTQVTKLLRRGRAPIEEGTCVVFSNHQLVHRILTMLNATEGEAHRDFVAMFVIDQREPVGTTLQPEVCPTAATTATSTVSASPAETAVVGANKVSDSSAASAVAATSTAASADRTAAPAVAPPSVDGSANLVDAAGSTEVLLALGVVQPKPYLVDPRDNTYAARDRRRRIRLFDQLKPKKRIMMDSDINGQSAYSTGNGSLAWIVSCSSLLLRC
jgi:hypothetical protein